MGRVKRWEDEKNTDMERGLIAASEDAVAGTDCKRKVFWETMFRWFDEKGPAANLVAERKYRNRTVKTCKSNFVDILPDVKKRFSALRMIEAYNPTCVNDDTILSMDIAFQTGKCNAIDYK